MNQIEMLKEKISAEFNVAQLSLDIPPIPWHTWWLDIRYFGRFVVVQWQANKGFGVSQLRRGEPAFYGKGADEVYGTLEETYKRVAEMLKAAP